MDFHGDAKMISFHGQQERRFVVQNILTLFMRELNAILNSISHLQGCTIYVSLFPCHECVKAIIQSGIKEIIYEDDKYNGTDSDRL